MSYSTKDTRLVKTLYSYLRQNGINVNTSLSYNLSYKRDIRSQIKSLIRKADCVIAIFTLSDKEQSAIFNEMKIGIESRKLVIPIVEKGIYPELPLNYRYIIYDKDNPWETLRSVKMYSEWLEGSNYRNWGEGKLAMGLVHLFLALSFFDALTKKNTGGGNEYGSFA
jgi:hypothetical protein